MNDVCLSKPSATYQQEYLSFYHEWVRSGEELIPWVLTEDPSNFPHMVQFLLDHETGSNLPPEWVPCSTYWLVSVSGRIIGAVNIRHRLTNELLNVGGHIGYGIRPSERRKGYATKLLALSLDKARELQINRILLTCDDNNIGSKRTILNNGGVQDANYVDEKGKVTARFWIELQ